MIGVVGLAALNWLETSLIESTDRAWHRYIIVIVYTSIYSMRGRGMCVYHIYIYIYIIYIYIYVYKYMRVYIYIYTYTCTYAMSVLAQPVINFPTPLSGSATMLQTSLLLLTLIARRI